MDSNIPNEAAKEITLDNASDASMDSLKSRGKQLANEEFYKKNLLDIFFHKEAKDFNSVAETDKC